MVTVCIMFYTLYGNLHQNIDRSKKELAGLALIHPVAKTIQLVQQHRGLSSGVLGGIAELTSARETRLRESKAAFVVLEGSLPDSIRKRDSWKKIITAWQHIEHDGMQWSRQDNFIAHTQLIDAMLQFEDSIADDFGLTSDSNLDVFYLSHTACNELLSSLEHLGQMRAYGTGVLGAGHASEQQKSDLLTLIALLRHTLKPLKNGMDKAAYYNPGVRSGLAATYEIIEKVSLKVIDSVRSDILGDRFSMHPGDFFVLTTEAIDNGYAQLYQSLLPTARELIQARIQQAENLLHIAVGLTLFFTALLGYFMLAIYFTTLESIRTVSETVSGFVHGKLQGRIYLKAHDELTLIGDSFNQMAQELSKLVEAEKVSADRMRAILDSSLDAMVQMNDSGVITGWSRQAEAVFGWQEAGVLGKSLEEVLIPPRYRDAYLAGLKNFHATGEVPILNMHVETHAWHRDGSEIPVELTVASFMVHGRHEFNAFIRDVSERQASEEKLRLLSTAVEQSPAMVLITDPEGSIEYVNSRFTEVTGFDEAELIGKKTSIVKSGLTSESVYRSMWEALTRGQYWNGEFINRRKNGETYIEEAHISPVKNADGFIRHYVSVKLDISQRRKTEENLYLAARVINEAHEGISICNVDGNFIDVNPKFTEITGYAREEVIGKNPRLLSSGRQSPEFYAGMWKTIHEQGYWQGEVWNRRKNGEIYAEFLTISVLRNEEGQIINYLGLFSDVTKSIEQQRSLEQMAHYDPLTGLPNRALFADRFHQAIARSKRDGSMLAVCYLDLDGFKPVNDTYGHDVGDRLLIEVAERIKSTLREEDTVSRQGGDEFALLLGDIHSMRQCESTLTRLHQAIKHIYLIDNEPITIGASSGVVIFPHDSSDPDMLLRHADQAMYQAKLAGKNRFHFFDVDQDQQVVAQLNQLQELERAFERGEFCLYYQPKIDMRSGEVIGAEALIRWNHPEKGLVPPLEFLPVMEDTSLSILVGQWVIENALAELSAWRKQGLDIQVSVNISPRQLQKASFFSLLDVALSNYPDIPSQMLQLEVLESSAVQDMAAIVEMLRQCRDGLGVSIALDDFGTGYSSLTHLRHLPADTIKIDQIFVRNMMDDPDDYAIVEGVVALASTFRRSVIAEGVETCDHGLILLMMGCFMAQGYGIARPMPASQFVDWVHNYQAFGQWKDFDAQTLTPQDIFIRSLEIHNSQWFRRIENALLASSEAGSSWPLMRHEKSLSGHWLRHARKVLLFAPRMLDQLDQAYQELFRTGNALMHLCMQGDIEHAKSGLKELKAANEAVQKILEEL